MKIPSGKGLFFLDSGSFSLKKRGLQFRKDGKGSEWDFYDSSEHWEFVEEYVVFVKSQKKYLDFYSNMDVIGNPELTYRNQKHLEDQGLYPVPVVHAGTNLKWLRKYMKEGYSFVSFGGLVRTGKTLQKHWLDRAFDMICATPDRIPKIKAHGFGITSVWAMVRYPWFSVDSFSWGMIGGFGSILIPRKKRGVWEFLKTPKTISVSGASPRRKDFNGHYLTMPKDRQRIVREWLEEIEVPLGEPYENEAEGPKDGVLNWHLCRREACIKYFALLVSHLPEWPWSFQANEKRGLL